MQFKAGSLGLVHWNLLEQVPVSDAVLAMGTIEDPFFASRVAKQVVWKTSNCVGQLAYQQYCVQSARFGRLDPNNPRWNPLKALPARFEADLCLATVQHAHFVAGANAFRRKVLKRIRNDELKRLRIADATCELNGLLQAFLVSYGECFYASLVSGSLSLPRVIGNMTLRDDTILSIKGRFADILSNTPKLD